MDIMNNMTVSTSKLTFSLIAISALLISGSGFVLQEASAFNAPEFTCNHINTTATHCTFNMSVNGTLRVADWGIDVDGARTAGDIDYTAYTISNIANSSSTGIGLTVPSAADKAVSNAPSGITDGLGFINGTDIVFIHTAVPSDATYYINYTNNPATTAAGAAIAGGFGAIHSSGGAATSGGEGALANKILKIGSNSTAKDWMVPSVVSAEIVKSNDKQVRVLMSEGIVNVNGTVAHFNFTTGGGGNDAKIDNIVAGNGSSYLYINLKSPADISDVLTLQFTTGDAVFGLNVINSWITDAIDSTKYTTNGAAGTAGHIASGHGNKLGNFTVSVTN